MAIDLIDYSDPGNAIKHVIADEDVAFITGNSFGLATYTWDDDGMLTYRDSPSASGYGQGLAIDKENKIVFHILNGTLYSSSYTTEGALTAVDNHYMASHAGYPEVAYYDGHVVATNGNILYLFDVDASGNLTLVDSLDLGTTTRGVYINADYVFVCFYYTDRGLKNYSYIGGTLTLIDHLVATTTCYSISGYGNRIFLHVGMELKSISYDGVGTLIEDASTNTGSYYTNWADKKYVYTAYSTNVKIYSYDAAGTLTHVESSIIDGHSFQALCSSIGGTRKFIFGASYNYGICTLSSPIEIACPSVDIYGPMPGVGSIMLGGFHIDAEVDGVFPILSGQGTADAYDHLGGAFAKVENKDLYLIYDVDAANLVIAFNYTNEGLKRIELWKTDNGRYFKRISHEKFMGSWINFVLYPLTNQEAMDLLTKNEDSYDLVDHLRDSNVWPWGYM